MKNYRPYNDNSELREDFGYSPSIWVVLKGTKNSYLITAYEVIDNKSYVHVGNEVITLLELFDKYCKCSNRPLGIESD